MQTCFLSAIIPVLSAKMALPRTPQKFRPLQHYLTNATDLTDRAATTPNGTSLPDRHWTQPPSLPTPPTPQSTAPRPHSVNCLQNTTTQVPPCFFALNCTQPARLEPGRPKLSALKCKHGHTACPALPRPGRTVRRGQSASSLAVNVQDQHIAPQADDGAATAETQSASVINHPPSPEYAPQGAAAPRCPHPDSTQSAAPDGPLPADLDFPYLPPVDTPQPRYAKVDQTLPTDLNGSACVCSISPATSPAPSPSGPPLHHAVRPPDFNFDIDPWLTDPDRQKLLATDMVIRTRRFKQASVNLICLYLR